jgi:hypothetical protein
MSHGRRFQIERFCQMQTIIRLSTRLFLIALISVSISSTCVRGGEPVVEKNVVQPPPQLFGTGWYVAVDMGANVFQSRGDASTFSDEFGNTLTVDPKTMSASSVELREVMSLVAE